MILKDKPEDFKEKFEVVSCFIEHESEILLLHRQDSKPQGNTWGVPAGKIDKGEDLLTAIIREINEETGISAESHQFKYFDKFYVRYPDYDFTYHIFHLPVETKPTLNINPNEHKDSIWKTPQESLELDLIQDEDFCIQAFYNI
ncbi:MAG: NUDIX hydrolase [bacterium]